MTIKDFSLAAAIRMVGSSPQFGIIIERVNTQTSVLTILELLLK